MSSALCASSRARVSLLSSSASRASSSCASSRCGSDFSASAANCAALAAEILGLNQRQAEQCAGVVGLDLERFLEKIVRHVGLPVFQVEAAPGHADIGVIGVIGHQLAEDIVGVLIAARLLQSFSPARRRFEPDRDAAPEECLEWRALRADAHAAARGRCFTCRSPPAPWQARAGVA